MTECRKCGCIGNITIYGNLEPKINKLKEIRIVVTEKNLGDSNTLKKESSPT